MSKKKKFKFCQRKFLNILFAFSIKLTHHLFVVFLDVFYTYSLVFVFFFSYVVYCSFRRFKMVMWGFSLHSNSLTWFNAGLKHSIVYSINDFRPICSGHKGKGFCCYSLSTNFTFWGLLPNNFSHKLRIRRSVWAFGQVLPYEATSSVVIKWQFRLKWLSYALNDVLFKFCGPMCGLFMQFIF